MKHEVRCVFTSARATALLSVRVAALVLFASAVRAEGDGGTAASAADEGAARPNAEAPLPEGPPPAVGWQVPARAEPPTTPAVDSEPRDRKVKTTAGRRRGPDNWTIDLGVHGYLVQAKHLLGGQIGVGRGIFAARFDVGAAWNAERVQRFDTILLGPYGSLSVWVFAYRSPRFEARAGLGLFAIELSEIDSSLLYFAGMTSGAASYFFTDHLSTFVRADVLPVRTRGFEIGVAPVMFQIGMEVSLW